MCIPQALPALNSCCAPHPTHHTGAGLLDQQNSFLGLLALHVTVFAILLVRSSADLDKYKNLIDEATFYDKQWNATWEGVRRPSESQQ